MFRSTSLGLSSQRVRAREHGDVVDKIGVLDVHELANHLLLLSSTILSAAPSEGTRAHMLHRRIGTEELHVPLEQELVFLGVGILRGGMTFRSIEEGRVLSSGDTAIHVSGMEMGAKGGMGLFR